MKVVILCGGSGTRLWPISRKSSPKQFAKIFGGESLFHLTLKRNADFADSFMVIVNELQLDLCKEQVNDLGLTERCEFLVEPVGRNTAPAIALAALNSTENETLLILPSDHLIKDIEGYKKCVSQAQELSDQDKLVTFGITPAYAETGYGYIEADGNDVKSFKEKPDLQTAKEYVESGNFLWNSGMFCFKASTFISELSNHSNEILTFTKETFDQKDVDKNTIRFKKELMLKIPEDSIDFAVMEKSSHVSVVPSSFNWSDLGSFDALYSELDHDKQDNATNENNIHFDSKNNLILNSENKIICTFGVEDLIIVDTQDALLIGKKGASQDVKKIVEALKEKKSDLLV